MKKLFLMALALIFTLQIESKCSEVRGDQVTMGYIKKGSSHAGGVKNPVSPWVIVLEDNVITMYATPCDYTLCLYDEDGEVVYTVFVPAGTTQVILPTTLSGDFELRFETSTYYYYGYISL